MQSQSHLALPFDAFISEGYALIGTLSARQKRPAMLTIRAEVTDNKLVMG
jgi:hypothetical protein